MSALVVLSTFPDADKAAQIARVLVEERLAACVNLVAAVRSIYRWQGAIDTSDEVAAIFKTAQSSADALITRIGALHSYDVPCVVAWPIDKILGAYADWVEDSVR